MNFIEKAKIIFKSQEAKIILLISAIWLTGCIVMLIPGVRYCIILVGEFFLKRPLNHPIWHERLIVYDTIAIIFCICFFCVYVLYIKRSIFRSIFKSQKAKIFLLASAIWLVWCFGLLIPGVRYCIIMVGEFFLQRPLNHQIWHERFKLCGIWGIFQYICSLCIYLLYKNTKNGKISLRILTVFFISVYCLIFVIIIMYNASWTIGDDYMFVTTSAINKYGPFSPFYGFSSGRFFPLGLYHFNILLFIFRCLGINIGLPMKAHLLVLAFFYIISFLSLYFLFKKTDSIYNTKNPIINLFFACTFFALGTSFNDVFLIISSAEAVIIMLFSIFMYVYYKAIETDKVKYYVIALLAAVYCTYCKEPVFGVFIVIAVINHIFRYKKESIREKIFYYTLITNGILYITLYYFLSYRISNTFYGGTKSLSFQTMLLVFTKNPILIIMFLFGFIRLYFIIIKKEREHMYFDCLSFSGMAYAFAYFVLNMKNAYYFMPAIILFCPSLVYWIKYAYRKKHIYALTCFFILIPLYIYNIKQEMTGLNWIYWNREFYKPYITTLFSEYNDNKEFIWYEAETEYSDNRRWRRIVLNAFLNNLNMTEGKEFFTSKTDYDDNDYFKQDILFFYPVENYRRQPMPNKLKEILEINNFEVFYPYSYHNEVYIYRRN